MYSDPYVAKIIPSFRPDDLFVLRRSRSRYRAIWQCGDTALVQNDVSGWTCLAHGIRQYPDGTVEWDYSTHGSFEFLPGVKA